MTVIQQIAQLVAPWADFYNGSSVAQSAVNFGHFGGMMAAGGLALATDRSTLRAAGPGGDKAGYLRELSAVHPLVVGALGVTALSGLLMFAADLEALALMQEHIPDVILLDIEMPRMDGYEVAAHVRNDARIADVPIIMITSRVGDKHRARAIELGVDDYMAKPFEPKACRFRPGRSAPRWRSRS